VATNDDVFDLEVLDRVLDDGKRVEISGDDDVGDVAVDENVARVETQDGCFRAARVGTSNPQDLRGLAFAEAFEERWIFLSDGATPFGVGVEDFGVGVILLWRDCQYW
jgi:hypothetical protein